MTWLLSWLTSIWKPLAAAGSLIIIVILISVQSYCADYNPQQYVDDKIKNGSTISDSAIGILYEVNEIRKQNVMIIKLLQEIADNTSKNYKDSKQEETKNK